MPLASNTSKGNRVHFYIKLLVYSTIALCLIFFDLKHHTFTPFREKISGFEVVVNDSIRPLKVWLEDFSFYLSSKVELARENKKLKTAQTISEVKLHQLVSLKRQLEKLHSLLQLQEHSPNGMHAVTVIADSDSLYDRWLRIQFKQGAPIKPGNYVISTEGLVGQVISVENDQGFVRLVSDKRASVHVQVLRTDFRAVAFGRGHYNSLELKFVPEEVDIKVDDVLITSGMGGRYPHGIPVGKVMSVDTESTSTFSRILVKSLSNPQSNDSFIALTGPTGDDLFFLDKLK